MIAVVVEKTSLFVASEQSTDHGSGAPYDDAPVFDIAVAASPFVTRFQTIQTIQTVFFAGTV